MVRESEEQRGSAGEVVGEEFGILHPEWELRNHCSEESEQGRKHAELSGIDCVLL